MERKALAITSLLTALPLPLVLSVLLLTVRIDVETPQADFQAYAYGTIGWFLLLIFVVPLTTIASGLTGYVAFVQSQFAARKLAIASFAVTAIGIVLLILFIAKLQS